jgi:polysaccharide export outer membrane protein
MFVAAAIVASLGLAGCSSAGKFTWYSQMPRDEWRSAAGEYVIGVGDVIDIRVYEQEGVSASLKVRSDGRIALPLVGDLTIAGMHPSELAKDLEVKLKQFIIAPRVTVNVIESKPITVTALGEVTNRGTITLEKPARLVQAMAQAGGPSDFADRSRIFVLRQFPQFQRIRFTYDAIMNNVDGAATFPLRTGDLIVVE